MINFVNNVTESENMVQFVPQVTWLSTPHRHRFQFHSPHLNTVNCSTRNESRKPEERRLPHRLGKSPVWPTSREKMDWLMASLLNFENLLEECRSQKYLSWPLYWRKTPLHQAIFHITYIQSTLSVDHIAIFRLVHLNIRVCVWKCKRS